MNTIKFDSKNSAIKNEPQSTSFADAPNNVTEHTVSTLSCSVSSSNLLDDVRNAYARDKDIVRLMGYLDKPSKQGLKHFSVQYRSSTDRYSVDNGLLYYKAVADPVQAIV